MFLLVFPSWKIAIPSGRAIYLAERNFSHLVYHLPIGFEHIFHLVLTFVVFCPYRLEPHFSKRSLEIILPLLTKPISQPPEDEFREAKKMFQSASEKKWNLQAQEGLDWDSHWYLVFPQRVLASMWVRVCVSLSVYVFELHNLVTWRRNASKNIVADIAKDPVGVE